MMVPRYIDVAHELLTTPSHKARRSDLRERGDRSRHLGPRRGGVAAAGRRTDQENRNA
jgi:hypothetical protein